MIDNGLQPKPDAVSPQMLSCLNTHDMPPFAAFVAGADERREERRGELIRPPSRDTLFGDLVEMAVEMIVDQWNPSVRRYRRETFCYGPKSCLSYKSGPTRKVPGRGSRSPGPAGVTPALPPHDVSVALPLRR